MISFKGNDQLLYSDKTHYQPPKEEISCNSRAISSNIDSNIEKRNFHAHKRINFAYWVHQIGGTLPSSPAPTQGGYSLSKLDMNTSLILNIIVLDKYVKPNPIDTSLTCGPGNVLF